jgi:C4-dicarboxylate-specific signal transduction histidine kinase
MSGAAAGLVLQGEERERDRLAHLLHALNQPLTGLQCSLELASSVPRSNEQQVRTLREGLALTARMRVLVEALRELVHSSEMAEAICGSHLEVALADCVDQLRPVAAARGVEFEIATRDALPILADSNRVATVLLRTITAALSLCQESSVLKIEAAAEGEAALVTVSWTPGLAPEFSPFSPPELGLLIAQAAWESSGGRWSELRKENRHICTLQRPLASGSKPQIGDAR